MTKLMVVAAIAAFGLMLGAGAAQATVSTFTVDHKGTLSKDGMQVTLTGTITCTGGDSVNIGGGVLETVGRIQRAAANFNNPVSCSGAPQTWSATFTSNSQRLVSGPANADIFASDISDFTGINLAATVLL